MNPDPNHPITDLDSTFSAISVQHTHRVMEVLRQAGVEFDVTVNGPRDDPNSESCDIFWFRPEADQQHIGRVISQALSGDQKV